MHCLMDTGSNACIIHPRVIKFHNLENKVTALTRPITSTAFNGTKSKLTKQISVLEKAVDDNRDVAQTKEKAINETKESMLQVSL